MPKRYEAHVAVKKRCTVLVFHKRDNCGTGAGGFQAGNDCAAGDGSSSKVGETKESPAALLNDSIVPHNPQTDTNKFMRYYENGPRTKDGEPVQFFHGTKKDFEEFQAGRYHDDVLFFSTNPEFAGEWIYGTGGSRDPSEEGLAQAEKMRQKEREIKKEEMQKAGYSYDDLAKADGEEWEKLDAKHSATMSKVKQRLENETGFDTSLKFESSVESRIVPVYVAAQNPFYPPRDYPKIESHFRAKDPEKFSQTLWDDGKHKVGNWVLYEDKETIKWLKDNGYDGVWITESSIDTSHETLAVWDNRLIKSSIGNSGDFDPDNPNITKAADNCGTGAGGFQPGNDCAAGDGSSSKPELSEKAETLLAELNEAGVAWNEDSWASLEEKQQDQMYDWLMTGNTKLSDLSAEEGDKISQAMSGSRVDLSDPEPLPKLSEQEVFDSLKGLDVEKVEGIFQHLVADLPGELSESDSQLLEQAVKQLPTGTGDYFRGYKSEEAVKASLGENWRKDLFENNTVTFQGVTQATQQNAIAHLGGTGYIAAVGGEKQDRAERESRMTGKEMPLEFQNAQVFFKLENAELARGGPMALTPIQHGESPSRSLDDEKIGFVKPGSSFEVVDVKERLRWKPPEYKFDKEEYGGYASMEFDPRKFIYEDPTDEREFSLDSPRQQLIVTLRPKGQEENKTFTKADNCGTGAGGFKPGNDCAAGDGSSSSDKPKGAPGADKEKQRAQTKTPEFKQWFGDSKVVDENGEPLIMFHGTSFDPKKIDYFSVEDGYGDVPVRGSFFSQRESKASTYAGQDGSVMPVYLKIQNPIIADSVPNSRFQKNDLFNELAKKTSTPTELTNELQKRGYDGVFRIGSWDGKEYIKEAVAFDSFGIAKSATENTGEFENSLDIRKNTDNKSLETKADNCGTGAGGFQPGNDCAAGDGSSTEEPKGKPGKDKEKQQAQTKTSQFKEWFGNSKVVNEDGDPMVVYHGTESPGHATFDPTAGTGGAASALYGEGVYFSTRADYAESYAKETGAIYPAYLRLENPFIVRESTITGKGKDLLFDIWSTEVNEHWANEQISKINEKKRLPSPWWGLKPTQKTQILKESGFDGVIDAHIHVAFDSKQIKSSTSNDGSFDPDSDNITKSADNCGTGAGGFKPGNDCAAGDGSSSASDRRTGEVTKEEEEKWGEFAKEQWQMRRDFEKGEPQQEDPDGNKYEEFYDTTIALNLSELTDAQKYQMDWNPMRDMVRLLADERGLNKQEESAIQQWTRNPDMVHELYREKKDELEIESLGRLYKKEVDNFNKTVAGIDPENALQKSDADYVQDSNKAFDDLDDNVTIMQARWREIHNVMRKLPNGQSDTTPIANDLRQASNDLLQARKYTLATAETPATHVDGVKKNAKIALKAKRLVDRASGLAMQAQQTLANSQQDFAKQLDNTVINLKSNGTPETLYRGIQVTDAKAKRLYDDILHGDNKFEFASHNSFTAKESVAKSFGKTGKYPSVLFRVKTKKGIPIPPDLSIYPDEEEVILPKNSTGTITNRRLVSVKGYPTLVVDMEIDDE